MAHNNNFYVKQGRLPMNNHSIESALELGIMTCLKKFQVTNPSLLLSANQLKETIRDTRYVPAVAASMAFILSKSKDPAIRASVLQAVQQWSLPDNEQMDQDQKQSMLQSQDESSAYVDDEPLTMSELGQAIEQRFRFAISARTKPAKRKNKGLALNQRQSGGEDEADEVGLDDFLRSDSAFQHESQMSQDFEDPVVESLERALLSSPRLSLASSSSSSNESMGASSVKGMGRAAMPNSRRHLEADEDDYDDAEWW
jgi:hypothetical protein